MLNEKDLIPYQTFSLPPGPWLVFAPHPDDETLGMGGTIALGVRAGIAVYVVAMTNGSQGGDPETRKQEMLNAATVLGLNNVFFWEFTDRALIQVHISQEKLISLLDDIKPKTVFLPHPQEFHPDHRAATLILQEFLKSGFFAGEVWLYEISRQSEINRLIDISSVVETKVQAIQCYPSQLVQYNYQDIVLSLNRARTYTLSKDIQYAEGFWTVSRLDNPFRELQEHVAGYLAVTNDQNPHVSIIVRTMNRPQLLAEALQSIADQSFKDIEAVIVCDGGEEVSPVVDRFKGVIQQITYIRHDSSKGRAGAANAGIKNASGIWISFLDDDDLLQPDALEKHLQKVAETGAKIVYGKVIREHYTQKGHKNADSIDYIYDRPFDRKLLFLQNYIPLISILLHKDVFSQCGLLDDTLAINEDWDFLIRASRYNEFVYHDSLVARYRCFGSATAVDGRLGKDLIEETEYRIRKRWWDEISPDVIDSFRQYVVQETQKHLNQELIKMGQKLSELQQENKSLTSHIQELEEVKQNLDFRKSQLELIQSSFSWRATAPLRSIRGWQKSITSKITSTLQKKNWK